jgi:hypothetical protein
MQALNTILDEISPPNDVVWKSKLNIVNEAEGTAKPMYCLM